MIGFRFQRLPEGSTVTMIITKLSGGLGNQMFQYAAGFSVAKRMKTHLFLDTRDYTYDHNRDFELYNFKISGTIAPEVILPAIKKENWLKYKLWKILDLNPKLLVQNQFDFNSVEGIIKSSAYLSGFWFSEDFFIDVASELRSEFRLKEEMSKYSQDIMKQIENNTSVSMHFRRGDYVAVEYWKERLGTCSENYYYHALDYIKSIVGENIHIFVFSDSIDWVKSNFKFNVNTYYVSRSSNTFPHEDLALMSSCRHHIIANSTFSWWGAWLNEKSDKIVVCPDVFYIDPRLECITPKSWKALPRTA